MYHGGMTTPRRKKSLVDLERLRAFLESIKSLTDDFIFGPNDGKPLYHYTDLGALQNIVTNGDMWLTNSRYSNDEEEITHGYRVANEAIEQAKAQQVADPLWPQYLAEVGRLVAKPTDEGVYICCFCKFDNLLSQWRGYAANGNGVSIEFNPAGFKPIVGAGSPHKGLMRLWKVFYDEGQQRGIATSALRFAFDHTPADTVEVRAQRAADAITFFIPTFKHNDFKDEEEWRLIFTPPPDCIVKPRFRVARNMLVPYYTLKDLAPPPPAGAPQKLPITGLRVGPSAQKVLNAASAQALIEAAEYDFEVLISNTPWRG